MPAEIRRRTFPLLLLLTLVGYWSPWIPHPAAGLVLSGLDLGEVVKFLPPLPGGQTLWREGFYLTLVTVSSGAALYAFRSESTYGPFLRSLLLILAGISALNLLPPAWTPTRLVTREFRLQSGTLVLLLGLIGLSPFAALLPRRIPAIFLAILSLGSLGFSVYGFLLILPTLSGLYAVALTPGWGFWLHSAGLILLAVYAIIEIGSS